ncbi:IS1096 element passenger TnpR family protein [Urechidicola croceus]|uniref:Plasmid pRiA4b Orf3-like domain-containing protein n=1 Tax=Urechidicola croceus TaxID=1850246 RepID=A0A1D8P3Z0_9FLAO|nr:hypothetical protein [Urechidicola croceus]AOW19246.1 hypothetical protein LPB138_00450 [Urechidicola croceus]
MTYKIRAILDVENDVIRDILIDKSNNLETLHKVIANAFGFNGQEMASFYRTDNDWNQGEEIPLFDMSDAGESISMSTCIIEDTLKNDGDKLIYVYDFFSMWTFYVELTEVKSLPEDNLNLPKVVFAFGDAPETAPEKEFTSDNFNDDLDFDNDDFNEFGGFENIDDYDF